MNRGTGSGGGTQDSLMVWRLVVHCLHEKRNNYEQLVMEILLA